MKELMMAPGPEGAELVFVPVEERRNRLMEYRVLIIFRAVERLGDILGPIFKKFGESIQRAMEGFGKLNLTIDSRATKNVRIPKGDGRRYPHDVPRWRR